jgi:quercetin dioxygenase-like cupin family protein
MEKKMGKEYTYIADLYREFQEIPSDGIISRTIYNDDHIKAILFGFAPGQELSEHTSSMPAVIHIVKGEARLKLGDDLKESDSGAWVHMPPGLPHSIYAKTPVVMLLILVKSTEQKG